MKHMLKRSVIAVSVTAAVLGVSAANATNGYFSHGYGTKANAMGGVGVALPQDAMAPATNPAGISWTGNRADAGIMLFNPIRDGELDATFSGGAVAKDDSGAEMFLIPGMGMVMDLAGDITMGMTMYGNGGMNTRYDDNIYFNGFSGAIPGFVGGLIDAGFDAGTVGANAAGLGGDPSASSTLGVNLAQLILAPTVSMKLAKDHSVGASLLLGVQTFRAYGFGMFKGFSSDPAHVTNNGNDWAYGAGVRFGYMGNLSDSFSVGATVATKIYMTEFDKYKGLFAEDGDFDIPANVAIGMAFHPNDTLTFAFDVQRIFYGDVKAIANDGPTAAEFFQDFAAALTNGDPGGGISPTGKAMGTSGGYGYGWDDQTVYKLGVAYDVNDQWTVRAGFNYGKSPIPDRENLLNITAPGVVEEHATIGFTYSPNASTEVSMGYMHAFRKDQSHTYTADNPLFGLPNQPATLSYDADIGMSQNAVEISYAYKF